MCLLRLVAIQICIGSILLSDVHCTTQQTYVARDSRMRHRGTYATDRIDPHNEVATLNTTTLLQQLPYRANLNDKIYRQHYSFPQHNTPAAVAKYRNLGNYYQNIELITSQPVASLPVPTNKNVHKRQSEYSNIPLRFDNQVLHLSPNPTHEIRPRRYTNITSIVAPTQDQINDLRADKRAFALEREPSNTEAQRGLRGKVANDSDGKDQPTTIKETQSYHDIFMRLNGPHQTSFGHVEFNPHKNFQKRFESLNNNNGNRHRGEIVWTDAQGGYGEHHWDLMQGKLR